MLKSCAGPIKFFMLGGAGRLFSKTYCKHWIYVFGIPLHIKKATGKKMVWSFEALICLFKAQNLFTY